MIEPHQQKQAIHDFQKRWKDRGNERQDTAIFWLEILERIFGVEHATEYIQFEGRVQLSNPSFIDAYIPTTKVLIEQKSKNVNLNQSYPQSDGAILSPYRQAKRYADWLRYSERPRWIVVSNFQEIHIHDQERPNADPQIVLLENLNDEFYRLNFLVDTEDDKIHKELAVSLQAGEIVGVLYRALLDQYSDPEDEKNLRYLNILCVRIVFCLYAEDARLFGRRSAFREYLQQYRNNPSMFRRALMDLFEVLDSKPEDRDPYISPKLAAFPYVNGDLFKDKTAIIPRLSDEIISIILDDASHEFDWSAISPTIFGSVFESTLNPESRREGGMHYTSIENIHKVIDPLFLNELQSDFEKIADYTTPHIKRKRLQEFQDRLGSLKFLDPACGSGNFLTETYLALRRLENKVLIELHGQQVAMGDMETEADFIKISISQFYGIEINDFAVSVANTALWISESQMLQETLDIVYIDTEFLPLTTSAHIVEGNALRLDWNEVIPMDELDYVMGNPPFVGHQYRDREQQVDMDLVFGDRGYKKLDYVCAWYQKSIEYMENTDIQAAYVSTNSISQGEQAILMAKLFIEGNVSIDFAYRSFVWINEAADRAAVHCVIIGFSKTGRKIRKGKGKGIFDKHGTFTPAKQINSYLLDAPQVVLKSRGQPPEGIPEMTKGSQPTDGGNLIFSVAEHTSFISKYPDKRHLLKRYVGSRELINNEFRYCLWLYNVPPSEYRNIPEIRARLEEVREMRLNSPTASVREDADKPYLFTQIRQPESQYLLIPRVSSEKRLYIPIAMVDPDVIVSDSAQIIAIPNLTLFSILTSSLHMAWMRTVCGRLEMRYRYSPFVYNNFPWPTLTKEQTLQVTETAKAILSARDLYPDESLADLYDLYMPPELRRAHNNNDQAVMSAYGFRYGMTEAEYVSELMKLYQERIAPNNKFQ